ncbi:MAG: GNAT family N-acetyltransferase [Phaeodactylibacter sp.]|nr:GNAT family N-acetyltransferase [Phaeodactylibacter sp.]
MKVILETPRLLLREMEERDAPGLLEMNTDPAVRRYLPFPMSESLEGCLQDVQGVQQQYKVHGIGRWSMELKTTGEFIGWTGLKYMTETTNGRIHHHDLGYRLLQRYWGHGYASESAIASAEYGFEVLQLQQIFGVAMVGNAASKRVLEKSGLCQTERFLRNGIEHFWFETPIPQL